MSESARRQKVRRSHLPRLPKRPEFEGRRLIKQVKSLRGPRDSRRPGTYGETSTNETEIASHIRRNCEAEAKSRFRHLGKHLINPGDHYETLWKIMYFAGGTALSAVRRALECTRDQEMVAVQGSVRRPPFSHSAIRNKKLEY